MRHVTVALATLVAASQLVAAPAINPSKPLSWGYPGAPFVLLITQQPAGPEFDDVRAKLEEVPLKDYAAQHGLEFFITEIPETGDPVVVLHEPVFGVQPYRDLAAVFELYAESGGGLLSTAQLPPQAQETFARMFAPGPPIVSEGGSEPWFFQDRHPFAVIPRLSIRFASGDKVIELSLAPDSARRRDTIRQTKVAYQELVASGVRDGLVTPQVERWINPTLTLREFTVLQVSRHRGQKESLGHVAAMAELWRRRAEAETEMLALAGSSIRAALAGQLPAGLDHVELPTDLGGLPPDLRLRLEEQVALQYAEFGFRSAAEARAFLAGASVAGLSGQVDIQIPEPESNMGHALVWSFPLTRPQEP